MGETVHENWFQPCKFVLLKRFWTFELIHFDFYRFGTIQKGGDKRCFTTLSICGPNWIPRKTPDSLRETAIFEFKIMPTAWVYANSSCFLAIETVSEWTLACANHQAYTKNLQNCVFGDFFEFLLRGSNRVPCKNNNADCENMIFCRLAIVLPSSYLPKYSPKLEDMVRGYISRWRILWIHGW